MCDTVFAAAGWACIVAQAWVLLFVSGVQGSTIYIIPPLPTVDNPCFRFQSTSVFCDPVVANWTSRGSIQQYFPHLTDASQFEYCVAPSDPTQVQFAFGCVNDPHLESVHAVIPTSHGSVTCAPPIMTTDHTDCEFQTLRFDLEPTETGWWVTTGSTLVKQTNATLLHPTHTSHVLRVNYSREPTEHDSIRLLPQDASCSAIVIPFTTLWALQRRRCGVLNPNGDSPSDISWDDINASWIGIAYFVLLSGYFIGTYFDAWRERIMLSQVYQIGIMQAQLPVILQLTWSTFLAVNIAALHVPFVIACAHFIYVFRVGGERRIGFPSKTKTESWKTLVIIYVLSLIIIIFTQVVVTYDS